MHRSAFKLLRVSIAAAMRTSFRRPSHPDHLTETLRLFVRYRCDGSRSDRHAAYYNYIAGECVKHGDVKRAAELTDTIQQDEDTLFKKATFQSLLHLYAHHNKPDDILRMKQIMVDKGQLLDNSTYSSLVSGLTRVGRVEDAIRQLREAQAQDVDLQARLFVPVIEKLVQLGRVEEGYDLWREMVHEHILWPNDVGLAAILRALSNTKREDWVRSIYQELRDAYRYIETATKAAITHWFERWDALEFNMIILLNYIFL